MTDAEIKEKRIEFLHATIEKYLKTDPKITEKELAFIIVWELGDISGLLKQIKKEVSRGEKYNPTPIIN